MNSDFINLQLGTLGNWELYMHENQSYLGRMYVLYNSPADIDLFDLSGYELRKLCRIVCRAKNAVTALFAPDRFNYSVLGNVFPRLHLHIIPRYRNSRTFSGIEFVDPNWGKNYSPYDRGFVLEQRVMMQIKNVLLEELCKNPLN